VINFGDHNDLPQFKVCEASHTTKKSNKKANVGFHYLESSKSPLFGLGKKKAPLQRWGLSQSTEVMSI
jgi:hypothetical protein